MKLNPKKCVFGVTKGKFLGHIVTSMGIEANPEKVKSVIDMETPKTVKDILSLSRKLATLGRFLSKSAEKSLPFYQAFKQHPRKGNIVWTVEAEEVFLNLKKHVLPCHLLQAQFKVSL